MRQCLAGWLGTADSVLDHIERGNPPIMVIQETASQSPNAPFAAVGVPCAFCARDEWGHGAWGAGYEGFDLNELVLAFPQTSRGRLTIRGTDDGSGAC